MEKMAKITFVVPAYNAESYIERCLDSICSQTDPDIRIVVVDDGSRDNTGAVVDAYAGRDSRIKVWHQSNAGLIYARKQGLELVETDYVMFVDADDWIEKTTAEVLREVIEETPVDMVVPGIYYAFDSHVEPHSVPLGRYEGREYFEQLMVEQVPHYVSSALYRTVLFDRVPWDVFSHLYMGEDLALNIFLASDGLSVVTLDQELYYYYQNPGSMSHVNYEKIAKVYDALDMIRDVLQEKGLLESHCQQMDFLYYLHGIHYHGIMPFQRNYQVRRKLRERWQEQNITIYDNPIYRNFAKAQPLSKKIFMWAYRCGFHVNYVLGAVVMPVFNWIKKR